MDYKALPGDVVVWGETADQKIPLLSVDNGRIFTKIEWESWKQYTIGELYVNQSKPFYAKLPFHYHLVPALLRKSAYKLLSRFNKNIDLPRTAFPGFPIEQGFELLHYVYIKCGGEPSWEQEISGRTYLTHDIDSADGFRWALKTAELEKKYGFNSVWNIVGDYYKIDYEVLDQLQSDGFEIGLHGYNHDNKLAFLDESEIRKRLEKCNNLIERYKIKSFRSPSWFRTPVLIRTLKDYISIDFSRLDTDIICPGGNGGCLWTKGFRRDGLLQIPTTVPFEFPLTASVQPEELVAFWKPKLEWLSSINGNIVINTHPDPEFSGNLRMLSVYEQLLKYLKGYKKRNG